jgi:hypothetical protein
MKKQIEIIIDGEKFIAPFKKFKTGRVGFGMYGKFLIDGVTYQIVCNIIKTESKL